MKACFLAGTLVETRDGRKAIESLREGDEVLSRDELTGEQGYKPVVQLFRGHTDKVAYVRIAEAARPTQRGRTERHRVGVAGAGEESGDDDSDPDPAGLPAEQTIRSTVGHPYYVVGRGWVPAGELSPGDQLVGSRGETVVVVDVEVRAEQADHFNIEVADWHTYFVAGDLSAPAVWVHNMCAANARPTRAQLLEELPESVYAGRIVDPRFNAVKATPRDFNPRVYTTTAGELEGRMLSRKHGIYPEQAASVRNLSNEDLVRFRMEDPISSHGIQEGIRLTGGHHRTAEIIRRVKAGELAPDTELHLLIHD